MGWSAAILRQNLGRSTFALRWSDFTRGTSLPEGEIIVITITNNSPILGRAISINIFNNNISSQTLCGTPAQRNRNAPYSSPEMEEKSLEYGTT